ncbi:MAG: M48 family metallopeptidase [Candidatus Saccharimonadales bacterium]
MAQKTVELPGIGNVVLAKRRGAKNLRLSIKPNGQVRVGLPIWAPYSAGIKFAIDRSDWILRNLDSHQPLILKGGDRIGKSYRLRFVNGLKISSRVGQNTITISSHLSANSPSVQRKATQACERALKKEAQKLLGHRLDQLAKDNQLKYKDLRIKRLISRWGSCSNQGSITLSYFLVQLPWHLIDYVILHELVHTQHHNHGLGFWNLFERLLPNAKRLRKEIKQYHPVLMPS